MSITISSVVNIGVTLTAPTTVSSIGTIQYNGINAAVVDGYQPGTLVNAGHIQGENIGVSLVAGGYINNALSGTISGLWAIEGGNNLSIVNSGLISGLFGISVDVVQITNQSFGIISGGLAAVSGTLVNQGLISSAEGNGVHFSDGGIVHNIGTSSQISEVNSVGVVITGAVGTVTNQGTINAVYLQHGGYVLNQNYLGGIVAKYSANISGAAGTINNQGFMVGAALQNGGYLTNGSAATISGYTDGVKISGFGTVVNNGTIDGLGGKSGILFGKQQLVPPGIAGVALTGGGAIINNSAAVMYGRHYGIMLGGSVTSAVVTNHGNIIGNYGIFDTSTTNDTIINNGTIDGLKGTAILLGNGNDTIILGSKSVVEGIIAGGLGQDTVDFNYGSGNATIANFNTEFLNIDSFINSTPTLSLQGPASLSSNQVFENDGILLSSGTFKIFGTFENIGTLEGAVTLGGNYFRSYLASPVFKNMNGGFVASTLATAISVKAGTAPVTITNAGTIEDTAPGGVALSFAASQSDVLVIEPGSVIIGTVNGGGTGTGTTGSVLELGADTKTGTISSIGSSFVGFQAISIAPGAKWEIDNSTLASVIDNGTVILNNTVILADTANLAVGVNSSLEMTGAVNAAATINFTGTNGTLVVANTIGLLGTINEFHSSDVIDLASVSFSAGADVKVVPGNMLDVIENGITTAIQFSNQNVLNQGYFHLSRDSLNGTDITQSAVPCFLAGTQIRTKTGDVPVEELKIGDLILNGHGTQRAVKWIGRRHYKAPLPDNPDIVPVLVKPGALSDNVPDQNLYLSPLHAVLIGTYLVPIGALINEVSIMNCSDMDEIHYYHIEMEDHDVIIANNTPAETFIDEHSRRMFDNAEEYFWLYPTSLLNSYVLFAPRLEFGPILENLRYKLLLRAGGITNKKNDKKIIGFLESADRRTITGWAYAPQQPHLPVSLDILSNGAVLARTIANIPRPDVKLAGYGHGRCGFLITLPGPLPALMRHEISVRRTGSEDEFLLGTPFVIDPGITHDLLKTGGLGALIDAAVRGASSSTELKLLGTTLETAGKKIQTYNKTDFKKPASRKEQNPIVLVLDEAWPTAAYDAGSNAVLSHIEAFQQLGFNVAFCATSGMPRSDAERRGLVALQASGVNCYGQEKKPVEATIRNLAVKNLAYVYLHRLSVANAYAGLVRLHAKTAKVIYSVADLHHLRLERQAAITDRPDLAIKAKSVKAAEFWAMQMADCVTTHSKFEADYLRRQCPKANIHVLPWAVAAKADTAGFRRRSHIAFIGGAGHAPNFDAVNYLAVEIMPRIWQKNPSIRCYIAGDGWPVQLANKVDGRIVFSGHQPDLHRFLSRIRLTVAPLRFGAGVKGKVLESLASGTPCVLTELAAEGIPLGAHLRSVVGDDDQLVNNILQVYADAKLQRTLQQSGLDLIKTKFSQRVVTEAVGGMLGFHQSKLVAVEGMVA